MSAPVSPSNFFWYDYETTGTSPWYDRPLQFGGLRTDSELNLIGEPIDLYCRPATDMLPSPEACLVTGLTPQAAREQGLAEHVFAERVHQELSAAGTCAVGYNSIRFDDEFTRHLLYRNFYDPYAREWQQGNSRWDLLNVMRLCRALRPDGIAWPEDEEGTPSFQLEKMARANGVDTGEAHNAIADARMTLELARLVRSQQRQLFDYALTLRDKRYARERLAPSIGHKAVLHVAGVYGNKHCCMAPVLPLLELSARQWRLIAFNLNEDPAPLLGLSDAALQEAVAERGEWALGLQTIDLNRCPVFAPLQTLDAAAEERIGIDRALCETRIIQLQQSKQLARRLDAAYSGERQRPPARDRDPEQCLYDGFWENKDKELCQEVRKTAAEDLAMGEFSFQDWRLVEMLFRYRARNFPENLTEEERVRWEEYRYRRLTEAEGGAPLLLDDYLEKIAVCKEQLSAAREQQLLAALEAWADEVVAG